MEYFKNIKVKDKLFGIIFGAGKVTQVFEDSHYKMLVTFKNGYEIPYTEDGIPGWGNFTQQTIFYKNDIDLVKEDFSPVQKILSIKKIIKYHEKGVLEIKLPSGIWMKCSECAEEYMHSMIEKENYHLFKKTKKILKKVKKMHEREF